MRGLTVIQPWATALEQAWKRYETRGYQVGYRGLVAIHAGKSQEFSDVFEDLENDLGLKVPSQVTFGAIIAVANLTDCIATDSWGASDLHPILHPITEQERMLGDWGPGRWAWHFKHVVPLVPIPWRGAQGLWPLPVALARSLEEAWEVDRRFS